MMVYLRPWYRTNEWAEHGYEQLWKRYLCNMTAATYDAITLTSSLKSTLYYPTVLNGIF